MKNPRTSAASDQFQLRLPEGMRDRIKAAADRHGRSMNAEIVSTLEDKYPAHHLDAAAVAAVISYLADAPSDRDFFDRVAEVNMRLAEAGSEARVEHSRGGGIRISADMR